MKFTPNRRRAFFAALPILLVNAIAIFGQMQFWHAHLSWPLAAVILFAIALESVAVFLAYHAHLAQLSNDSATRLRFASYAIGLVIGLLNASHYLAPGGSITAAAIAMGIMSAISPWLWAVHARRQSRDQLRAQGLIEPHALRLGITRWMLWPRESFEVFRNAIWNGVTTPALAIKEWEARYDEYHWPEEIETEGGVLPLPAPASATTGGTVKRPSANGAPTPHSTDSKAKAVRIALDVLGGDPSSAEVLEWLAQHGRTDITASAVRVVKSRRVKSA